MTWLQDEQSIEDGAPREGIEIRHGLVRHRIATGSRDIAINGNLYKSDPAAREHIGVSFVGAGEEVEISLPVSHAFAQRWLGHLSPPRNATVEIWRQQQRSGEAERIWRGVLSTCKPSGHVAKFCGLASAAYSLQRQLSTITIGRNCPHVLYDGNCRVLRSAFRVATTVSSHDGLTVTVASIGGNPDSWAKFGEIVHTASGERMTVTEQVGTELTLHLPIPELADGAAVEIFAGCDHSITDCASKFENQPNYGGSPRSPKANPMIPGKNLGIIVQE